MLPDARPAFLKHFALREAHARVARASPVDRSFPARTAGLARLLSDNVTRQALSRHGLRIWLKCRVARDSRVNRTHERSR